MKKYQKVILFILVFIIIHLIATSCMQFRKSNKQVKKIFENAPVPAKIHTIAVDAGKRHFRYIKVSKSDSLPLVIFVHGAPGASDAFYDFMKDSTLVDSFQMISVDRAGYGYSDFGKSEPSILKQAQFIAELPDFQDNNNKIILLGHSFGAPIVARMAIEFPEQVAHLILVAGTIDPDLEQIFWISYPADWWIFRWLVPTSMRVANDEKLRHVAELQKMDNLWQKITQPTTIIQGGKDFLAPAGNLDFALQKLKNASLDTVFIPSMNHFTPWTHPHLIKEALLKYQ